MDSKKAYKMPKVRTETIKIGVFGNYGDSGDDDGHCNWSPVNIFAPLFGWCCS